MSEISVQACVPLPLQIVVDDVGWWSGRDGSAQQEPYRTGMGRDHCLEDYRALVRLGRELQVRPQAAMVLCEWDRTNLLRGVPTSTWMGAAWDNRRWVGPWLDEAAALLRDHSDHLELVLHGVGHEYWEGGTFTRAEWHGPDGRMRPRDQVLSHLDAFARLMRQNDLGDFPTSFVPAAFRHAYGDRPDGLAALLAQWGITFASTPFASMHRRSELPTAVLGVDAGVTTVDRGTEPAIPWLSVAAPPADPPGPILGLHWPNLLHAAPERNALVVDAWVAHLRALGRRFERVLAADVTSFRTQLAYHLCAALRVRGAQVECDLSALQPIAAAAAEPVFMLRVRCAAPLVFSSPDSRIVSTTRLEPEGHYTLVLEHARGARCLRVQGACRGG